MNACPCLDVARVPAFSTRNALRCKVFDELKYARILPDGSQCNAVAMVEVRILDQYIRRVGFRGDSVIAVVDCPIAKYNIRRVKRVRAVGVLSRIL